MNRLLINFSVLFVITILCLAYRIVSGTLAELVDVDFGEPLHTVVLCGAMHDVEQLMYERWHWNRAQRAEERQQQQSKQEEQQNEQWERERKERKAGDEIRKKEVERRKQEEKQKQDVERQLRKEELQKASADAASDDETDGVDFEPLV